MPPWYVWFVVGNAVFMALIGGFLYSIKMSFVGAGKIKDIEHGVSAVSIRVDNIEIRMDRAGEKVSDLATDVQGMPERLRHEFVTKEYLHLVSGRGSGSGGSGLP